MITISIIILAFTAIIAICRGDNVFQQCRTEADLAAPNCNLKDLSNEVLIGIIERTGFELTHDVDSYTHDDLVREAAYSLEEEGECSREDDYPIAYYVSGAGTSQINGKYDLSIQDNGEAWYTKQMSIYETDPEWIGKELTIMRCEMFSESDGMWWFISEVTEPEQPCTSSDIDHYGLNIGDELPSESGWISTCHDCQGEDPPPTLLVVDEDEDLLQNLFYDYLTMMKDWPQTSIQSMVDHLLFEHDVGYEKKSAMRKLLLPKVEGLRLPHSLRVNKDSYNHYSQRVYRHGYQKLFNMIVSQIFETEDIGDYYKIMAHLLKLISNDTRFRRARDETMKRLKSTLTSGIKKERLDIEDTRYLLSVVLESNPSMFGGAHDFLISEKEIIVPEKTKSASHPQTKMNLSKTDGGQILVFFALLFFAIAMIGFICLLLYELWYQQRKRSRKKNSPLSCHQPIMKKIIYVKLSATKRLNGNQGRKINGLINKSGVQDIQIERKTDQPTIMYKVKASNGETYVHIHIKGSKEALQKAVVLIQEAVGKENVEEEIELPSTFSPSEAAPHPKPRLVILAFLQLAVTTILPSSSAPPKTPKKRKSRSPTLLWSSLCIRYHNLINYIRMNWPLITASLLALWAILFCMIYYWKVDCMIIQDGYVCQESTAMFALAVAFCWLSVCIMVLLALRVIAYCICIVTNWLGWEDSSVTKVKAAITLYAILCCIIYWNVDCMLFGLDMTKLDCKPGMDGCSTKHCRHLSGIEASFVAFLWLFPSSAFILALRAALPLVKTPKSLTMFGVLCCTAVFAWREGCKNRHEKCEQWADLGLCAKDPVMRKNCQSSCNPHCHASLSVVFLFDLAYALVILLILSGMIVLLSQVMANCMSVVNLHLGFSTSWLDVSKVWERLRSLPISIFNFFIGVLRMPFDLYQAKRVRHQTIYVKSSQTKNLIGKQGKKKKEIMTKSGIDDIHIDTGDGTYVSVDLIGTTQGIQKAIALIQKAIGIENWEIGMPSSSQQAQTSSSKPTHGDLPLSSSFDDNGVRMDEPSLIVSPSSSASMNGFGTHQDQDVVVDRPIEAASHTAQGESIGSLAGGDDASEATQGDEVLPEPPPSILDRITNFLYSWSEKEEAQRRAAVLARSNQGPSSTLSIEEEDVPSKVVDKDDKLAGQTSDIESSSVPAVAEKESPQEIPSEIDISNFALNNNDPLLIFLRSQHQCIKGSVEEFYTWLVTYEDIDSMLALKEAVSDDNYLNNTMRVGDGSSGLKGFKRETFKVAVSEYEDSKPSKVDAHCLSHSENKALGSNPSEPPEELVCPISLVLMTNDPVVAADGITYERASIEDWFQKSKAKISEAQKKLIDNPHSEADQRIVNNGVCSPVLGSEMKSLTLMPNIGIRNMARAFKEKAAGG